MSSNGGAPTHPDWYFNLEADPNVKAQIKADRFAAHAAGRDSPEERARIWPLMVEVWPDYDEYTTKTRSGDSDRHPRAAVGGRTPIPSEPRARRGG